MDRIVDTNEERARGLVAAFAHTELQGTRVGIEDNYLMTASGLELLSHFPRELIVCGE